MNNKEAQTHVNANSDLNVFIKKRQMHQKYKLWKGKIHRQKTQDFPLHVTFLCLLVSHEIVHQVAV